MQKLPRSARVRVKDVAVWRKLNWHWFVGSRTPPSTGESVADLQALLGDILEEVTPDTRDPLPETLEKRSRGVANSSSTSTAPAD